MADSKDCLNNKKTIKILYLWKLRFNIVSLIYNIKKYYHMPRLVSLIGFIILIIGKQ